MQPDRSARRRVVDALGRLLVAGGCAFLLVWGVASGHSALGSRIDRHLLLELESAPEPARATPALRAAAPPSLPALIPATPALAAEPDTREWSWQRLAVWVSAPLGGAARLGLLELPSAGIAVALLDGTDELSLNRGVGRIAGTASASGAGNLGIAGHRDGFFRALRHVREGDALRLVTPDGERRYRVEWTRIVSPDDVSVLAPTEHDAVTLVTCHPFWFVGPAPERFIVRARAETELALAPPGP